MEHAQTFLFLGISLTNLFDFQEDELRMMLKSAARIEFHYSHWIDEVIVNDDLSSAFERLLTIVSKIESEPLWVPASWVQ